MDRLFGTDGIRGKANRHPITAEMALRVGKATALFLRNQKKSGILIAKDSRISGDMLEAGLAAGICSTGVDAILCGILPTPGVAWLTVAQNAAAGISVSASHNPYDDNGIKIFRGDGFKLSQEQEDRIERLVFDDAELTTPTNTATGRVAHPADCADGYKRFLLSTLSPSPPLRGMKIVIDCANGAASRIASQLFSELGAEATVLFNSPNGKNINDSCGSEHPQRLKQRLLETTADVGIAFDGDGDRLLVVDERGEVLSGDELLAIFADHLRQQETLRNKTVVSTVMSNIGLGAALKEMGFAHILTDVGDRHVVEKMRKTGAVLGGENSGHLIFLNHHTTGDGMLSALQLLRVMQSTGKSVSQLKTVMTRFPQALMNVKVKRKPDVRSIPAIEDAIQSVRRQLGEKGRVLVRYSGTQPLCRVMVEGPTRAETDAYCRRISECIQEALG